METIEPEALKNQFIAWQCRIRQYSVRKNEGRPSSGMQPELIVCNQSAGNFHVQMVKTDSKDVTREFQFMARKTEDPQDRYSGALKLLSEYYYQIPSEFDEEMTAVYSLSSELADQIVQIGECDLVFEQANQKYKLRSSIRRLSETEDKYQATYWHNSLFNTAMPGVVKVLGFIPDWKHSTYHEIAIDESSYDKA